MKNFPKRLLTAIAAAMMCALCLHAQARAEDSTIRPTIVGDIEDEDAFQNSASFDVVIPAGQESVIVPVEMPLEGVVRIEASRSDNKKGAGFRLYSNSECTKYPKDESSWGDTGTYYWVKQSVYYLKLSVSSDHANDIPIAVKACCYRTEPKKGAIQLANKKWVTAYDKHMFKIVVPKRGYIRVETVPVQGYKKSDVHASCSLYDRKKREYDSTDSTLRSENNYSHDIAVEKGTYYVKIDYGSHPLYKMRYSFHADPSKQNYTMEKAIPLKPGKNVTNAFYSLAKESTYQRWYKIQAPKKKRLTITYRERNSISWDLYDLTGKRIDSFGSSKHGAKNTYYSYEKVKPGTYYLGVSLYYSLHYNDDTRGEVVTFQWN